MIKIKNAFKIVKGRKSIESTAGKGLRYIQIDDLRNNNQLKYAEENSSNILCEERDILIAWDGANAGTIGYGLEGAIGSTIAKLTPKTDDIHSPFAGRFLQSKFKFLRNKCTGATIPHISSVTI